MKCKHFFAPSREGFFDCSCLTPCLAVDQNAKIMQRQQMGMNRRQLAATKQSDDIANTLWGSVSARPPTSL